MKKSFLIMVVLLSLATLAFAGAGQNQNRSDGLDADQKATIYSVYEEEKVARDVYKTLGDLYPEENTFANIQLSEQTHMDAVRNLCVNYGIEIPVSDAVGAFTSDAMRDLYQSFVDDGKTALTSALHVGIDIETMDIEDLGSALYGMPYDVQQVFINLLNGSSHHLDAFTIAIEREPQP